MKKSEDTTAKRLHRFVKYVKSEKMIKNARNFEDICGLSNGYLNNALHANAGNLGSENIARIVDKFPMLNIYWLCTGKGEMLNYEGKEKEYQEVMLLISKLQEAVQKMYMSSNNTKM